MEKYRRKRQREKDLKSKFTQATNQFLSTTFRTSSPTISTALSRYFKNEQFVISAGTSFSQHLLTIIPVQSGETPLNSDQARRQKKDDKAMPANSMQTSTTNQ